MILQFNKNEWFGNIKNDILGGLVTSIASFPKSLGLPLLLVSIR